MTRPARRSEGNARLLRLARILEKVPDTVEKDGLPTYYQKEYQHACGTPSCGLGHWAAANPGRWLIAVGWGPRLAALPNSGPIASGKHEFGLQRYEWDLLFDAHGCNNARTGKEAAAFIRQFVKERT